MTMIGNINSSTSVRVFPRPPMENYKLTDDQKSQLQDILTKYDAESISDDEMKSMLGEIREAGIRPGEDLKNALEEAGFELKKPPAGNRPPMGMNKPQGVGFEPPQFVQDFMAKAESGDVSEDDVQEFLKAIQSQKQEFRGAIFDQSV
ncbi:MAG TPA: hypothetical protein PKE64_28715 [Anaerolineae bacterium]|nr:hypothetical protein [Anaerolineae bacterium]HMR68014.1 hypothetical protein [Anaerolineae bacterium]